jgi:hypothetical protein
MRIGLDVDGILYNWEQHARKLLKYEFGITLPESSKWSSIEESITESQWRWLWSTSVLDLFMFGSSYPEVSSATKALKDLGIVSIITNIPRNIIPIRLGWLLRHEIWFDEFRTSPNFNKTEILPLCDIYIDDSPFVAEDILNRSNKKLILWNRPWNQDFNSDKFYYRVSSWNETLEIIKNHVND